MSETPQVYGCIAAVGAEMAQAGIRKDKRNQQQGYSFRGIDDVYNALAPMLAKHGLVILPRILSREVIERQTQKGGTLFYVTVEAEFDFVAAADGSKHVVRTFGEAMDSADKATNKAMSAAYKYAALQAFCIPTEGDNDADATTHDVAAAPEPAQHNEADEQPAGGIYVTNAKVAKTGTSGKGPWTLYAVTFSDRTEGTTFSKSIFEAALKAKTTHAQVEPQMEGKNLIGLLPVRQLQDVS